jgi:hypothetical protein
VVEPGAAVVGVEEDDPQAAHAIARAQMAPTTSRL